MEQGTTNKNGECATCFGKLADCPGHFGHTKLEMPVFHIGYLKNILQILQCICKVCGIAQFNQFILQQNSFIVLQSICE